MKTKNNRKVTKARGTAAKKRRNATLDAKTAETLDRLVGYYMFGIWNGKVANGGGIETIEGTNRRF